MSFIHKALNNEYEYNIKFLKYFVGRSVLTSPLELQIKAVDSLHPRPSAPLRSDSVYHLRRLPPGRPNEQEGARPLQPTPLPLSIPPQNPISGYLPPEGEVDADSESDR